MPDTRSEYTRLALGLAAVAVVTLLYVKVLHVSNPATVSTTFLLVVLVMAATSRLWAAVVTSVVAMLAFNYFFLPPVGTFTIADPQNWVALVAFVAVSLVASNLSAAARARAREALARRDELARLFDLSRDVMMMTDRGELARSMARRFDLAFAAVALPGADAWDVVSAGTESVNLDPQQLWSAFSAAQSVLEFDARTRAYSGHRTVAIDGRQIQLVPLRAGTRAVGILAASGRPMEAGTLDALAGIAAIAIERAQFLDERKTAELTRQSEQLKAALLASLGHDLRTPLTAIRLAATNIKQAGLDPAQRDEQSDLILSESERLARLFENILAMARIDAEAVTAESRWTHPSEILEAARDQVAETLRGHSLNLVIESDEPVRIDPRLAATAVAHILENAAQYAPVNSAIDTVARLADEGLMISIRDHGPGISHTDLPHLFERFYRGERASAHTSGTGMGLWIARGLLAVQGGRIWAENCPDGGAQFTITIPVSTRDDRPAPAESPA
jgi:two-component system, OmpR family, sensor histidine kinase KdpD